jgi:hypothetical protein
MTNETNYTLIADRAIKFEPLPNNFIFCLKNEPIIVIDEVGFKYKGELIEDKGEVYRLFKEFLKQDKTN